MRSLLPGLLLIAATASGAADWPGPLIEGGTDIRAEAAKFRAAVTAEIPGDGGGLRCVPVGRHTEQAPWFNPLDHGCKLRPDGSHDDPLPDSLSYKTAFEKVVAQVIAKGGPLAGREDKLILRGNPDPDGLDEKGHWTDLAHLRYRKKGEVWVPADLTLTVYRAYKSAAGPTTYLQAQWMSFTADMEGKLSAVQTNAGERSENTGRIMWVQNGKRMLGDPNNMPGLYELYWRQLVKSWTEAD